MDAVRSVLATPEEMEAIAALDGPDVKFDRPEAFLKVVMGIPRIGTRLKCWCARPVLGARRRRPPPPLALRAASRLIDEYTLYCSRAENACCDVCARPLSSHRTVTSVFSPLGER